MIGVYATDKWLPPVEAVQLPSEQQIAMFEYRVEVIDTRSGTLLASQILSDSDAQVIGEFLPRTRLVAVSGEEDLLPVTRILEYDILTQ